MITLKAPSGVTRIAGAKPYATKFATSPRITESEKIAKSADAADPISTHTHTRTGDQSGPPQRLPEIAMAALTYREAKDTENDISRLVTAHAVIQGPPTTPTTLMCEQPWTAHGPRASKAERVELKGQFRVCAVTDMDASHAGST